VQRVTEDRSLQEVEKAVASFLQGYISEAMAFSNENSRWCEELQRLGENHGHEVPTINSMALAAMPSGRSRSNSGAFGTDYSLAPGTQMSRRSSMNSEVDAFFTLLLDEGTSEDLLLFLRTSYFWFSSLVSPPTRNDFKIFLEGGYVELARTQSQAADVRQSSLPMKTGLLELISEQLRQMDGFLSQLPPGNEQNPQGDLIGCDVGAPGWENGTLTTFLDAATDITDFRQGFYDESWIWLLRFYQAGQYGDGGDL